MTSSTPLRDSAFISYSHKDRALLEHFQAHIKPLIRDHNLRVWDDTNIKPGDTWKAEIERAIASARVAVLLISRSFLASDFIAGEELPKLLKAAKDEGARILPVILSPSVFQYTPLSQFQTVNDPARPLSAMSEHQQEEVWANLAIEVYQTLTAPYPIGTRLLTYTGHQDTVNSVAWSPDGKRIASASGGVPFPDEPLDYSVQIWEAATGQHLITYQGHISLVNAVAWAPYSKHIVSASADGIIQIWEAMTGFQVLSYKGHSSSVEAVAWSPDGCYIVSAGEDKTIRIWESATGHQTFSHHKRYRAQKLTGVLGSRQMASASDLERVAGWLVPSGGYLFTCNSAYGVDAIGWSPDGKFVYSGTGGTATNNSVQVYSAESHKNSIYKRHLKPVLSVTWSPDGKRIASASADKTVQVWEAITAQHLYTYSGHTDGVTSVAWSPDGRRIASASADKTVQVWSAG